MNFGFEHSYAALPDRFFARLDPARAAAPRLIAFNVPLARDLRLDVERVRANAAAIFSGLDLPEDARPLAMAYAGHQFGHFVPQLGDGRAILLGELRDRDGVLRDVQLKGSGLTPFSRTADGRAALGPMLREYLVSEAMHALGIPTTRSLAVVATGETVRREELLPGAVLTRVAASHVRVGTFEFFAARGDREGLRALLDYVIDRHYPEARGAPSPALAVLESVVARQSKLIAQWMLVGFIHGVMNTDNMAISGETIDYGPCAFMDEFHPMKVFSSIDQRGRYAYGNQPAIAQWNLARFAETLLPLLDTNADRAVQLATAAIEPAIDRFDDHYLAGMRRKLGLTQPHEADATLVRDLLSTMQQGKADFTLTFRRLCDVAESADAEPLLASLFLPGTSISAWLSRWRDRLALEPAAPERAAAMRTVNPAFIPRNHRVEAALVAATGGDLGPFERLVTVLQRPFDSQPEAEDLSLPPAEGEQVLQTFCGT
jgi:protein adenylyltransferase